jgi:sec-independent protein translocase protein TatA
VEDAKRSQQLDANRRHYADVLPSLNLAEFYHAACPWDNQIAARRLRRAVAASWEWLNLRPNRKDRKAGGISMIEGLLQPTHLLVILAVAVLMFGPKKLPDLGKGLAEGIKSFKEGIKDLDKPDKPK